MGSLQCGHCISIWVNNLGKLLRSIEKARIKTAILVQHHSVPFPNGNKSNKVSPAVKNNDRGQ